MINNDTAKSTYTVTEGVTEYPIGFQYTTNPDGTPNLYVWYGDNTELEYGVGYTLSDDGLSIVLLSPVEVDETLTVAVDEPFIQDSDYVVGRIDPEQIEKDFDKSVLRDLELRDYADDINNRLADEIQTRTDADAALQDAIDDEVAARSLADTTLQDNIDAEADAREDADDALQAAINTKQDIIVDLATIRSGAAAGATAVQPNDLSAVATSGSYNDLLNRPTIPATAADVHALPDTTKYGASLALSVNPTTFVVTAQLKDQNNSNLGTPQTIDLPLESVVVSGTYDAATKEVVLTLESGSTIRFSVADLVSGLQTEITSVNMLDADLVDDASSVHKFVTSAEKTSWDNKVSKSGDTMTGDLNMGLQKITFEDLGGNLVPISAGGQYRGVSINRDIVLGNGKIYSTSSSGSQNKESGTALFPWDITHTKKINNGADIAVPTSGGTMARLEDLPDVSHMVTDNTAQSITAVKTLVSASASNTTPQVILANYAVKFGTSDNNDLFSISADANTSTLSIVGDSASNIIDIAASGAVLNHLQVTSSDVTFGGNSLINPSVMTGADGTNAGTSGLVPAPAATDNDKFLSGDGTWKTAGGGSTYTAGNGISIDANNEISVTDPVLVNRATGDNCIGISRNANITATGTESIAIGTATNTSSRSYNIAIGCLCSALRNYSIALGKSAEVYADNAMQINMSGTRRENRDANTVKIGNANGNYEIMSADGTVPTARLTKVNTTITLASADWSSNTQTVNVTGMTATGVVFVNPDPTDQADYTSAGILCTAQGAGTLTFTCDTTPTSDIDVVVIML